VGAARPPASTALIARRPEVPAAQPGPAACDPGAARRQPRTRAARLPALPPPPRRSYFGVGSKNAAFYLGRTVKVVTRPAPGAAGPAAAAAAGAAGRVHELCISGAELERRFRAGEVVYEEDMVHRPPGVAAAAGGGDGVGGGGGEQAAVEAGFAPAAAWLAEEAEASGGRGRVWCRAGSQIS
jgi:hypothetical protein